MAAEMLRPTVLAVRAFSRCGGYVSVVLYGWGRRKSVDLYMYVCGKRQGAWAHSPETRQAACPKVQNWRDGDLEVLPVGVLGGSVCFFCAALGGRRRLLRGRKPLPPPPQSVLLCSSKNTAGTQTVEWMSVFRTSAATST